MALTYTSRGVGTHLSPSTTLTLQPTSNFTDGALAIICIAADNSSSGGSTNNIDSVTDSLGNKWVARTLPIFDNGAASAGVQGAIFTTDQSAGTITSTTDITISFSAKSTTAKTVAWLEVTAGAGKKAMFLTGANSTGQASSTSPTVTTSSIEVGDLVVAMVAIEAGTSNSYTDDADTTNGTWSAAQYAEIGTTSAGSALGVQTKVQTTTASTQTFNPTLSPGGDLICSWIQVREITVKNLALNGVG